MKSTKGAKNWEVMVVESKKTEVLGLQNVKSKAFGEKNQPACDC